MDEHDLNPEFEPRGYCPRCDYHADIGTCPECGFVITPASIRKAPRGWFRKRARLVIVTLVVLIGATWFVSTRPDLVPHVPTFFLLQLQASSGRWSDAARQQLAQRYTNGRLTQSQVTKFARQWCDVRWATETGLFSPRLITAIGSGLIPDTVDAIEDTDLFNGERPAALVLFNGFVNRGFPFGCKMSPFRVEEVVRGLRLDGTDLEVPAVMGERRSMLVDGQKHWITLLTTRDAPFPSAGNAVSMDTQAGFHSSTLSIVPSFDVGHHQVQLVTTVVVTDLATNKVAANWPLTHEFEIDVKGPPLVPITSVRVPFRNGEHYELPREPIASTMARIVLTGRRQVNLGRKGAILKPGIRIVTPDRTVSFSIWTSPHAVLIYDKTVGSTNYFPNKTDYAKLAAAIRNGIGEAMQMQRQ